VAESRSNLERYDQRMSDVIIGKGAMSGKGLYAARDFKKNEVVVRYELKPITFKELKALAPEDYAATHNVNGQIYMYSEPARYVNHSDNPNVRNDHGQHADVALRDIEKGELVTVDARYDDVPVLKKIAAILVKVPSIERGLDFYREQLGMQTVWKKEDIAAVRLGDSNFVLSTRLDPKNAFLVDSAEHAVAVFERAGGKVVAGPEDTPVGQVAVVEDPFGNRLTLVDLSRARENVLCSPGRAAGQDHAGSYTCKACRALVSHLSPAAAMPIPIPARRWTRPARASGARRRR
jgi:catechol 2,3-dioxygenase-like lactoylglutathione lyase family enzyme